MATTTVEKNLDDEVSKFYLESLESLQIKGIDDKCNEFTHLYCDIRGKIQKFTKYRSLRKLGPILLYFFLKTRGILLVLPGFLDLCQMNYGEFVTDLKSVVRFYPEFKARDKKFIIKEYITTILKSLTLDEKLTSKALTLFDYFYPLIQYTKEEVIAAIICVLIKISFDFHDISLKFVCEKAGIRQSVLNQSFIKKIFPYLGIPDNTALKNSFEVIREKVRKKFPLLGINKITVEEKDEEHPKAVQKKIVENESNSLSKIAQKEEVQYPPMLTSRVVELRRKRMSIKDIAKNVDDSEIIVRKILKKHFPEYRYYNPVKRNQVLTLITPEVISQVIELRRQYMSIRDISKKVGLNETKTEEILNKKLLGYQQFEPVFLEITHKIIDSILSLNSEKYSDQNIADTLDINVSIVNMVLKEIIDMWSKGFTIIKIAEKTNIPKSQVVYTLKKRLGDYRNHKIRYRITQQEIDSMCQLKKNGCSYPEIAQKFNRRLELTKKMITNHLEDHTKYNYIPPKHRKRNNKTISKKQLKAEFKARNQPLTPQIANFYMNYQPVVYLLDSLLEDIKMKRSEKTPLDELSHLLLNNEEQIKKNISQLCNYLSKINKFRAEKTILGLVLVLSIPQVTQTDISNLVGVSPVTLRNNLSIKNIRQNFGSTIKEDGGCDIKEEGDCKIALIEDCMKKNKNILTKDILVRFTIIEMMNEKTTITTNKISQRNEISMETTRRYVKPLWRAGELIVERKRKDKYGEISHMWLNDKGIYATYNQFLLRLPENCREKLFSLLEERFKNQLILGAQINTDLIFEYLETIISAIQKNKITKVEPRVLKGLTIKVNQIKTITHKIVRIIREKQLYKEEPLILAMAIYLSCPFIDRFETSGIISSALKIKVSPNRIEKFQEEISLQKMFINNNNLRFKHLGGLVEERRTETLCVECGDYIYAQLYQNKKIFVCKHCLKHEG